MIEEYMIWIWLGLFVLAIIIEAITQDFVSIWFAVGALVAMCIASILPYWGEIIVFSVISVVALIGTRPLVRRMMDRQGRSTNTDEFVGQRLKAISDIDKYEAGSVKLNGITYTAILMEDSNEPISKDSLVEVVALKGNRVVVKKIEE